MMGFRGKTILGILPVMECRLLSPLMLLNSDLIVLEFGNRLRNRWEWAVVLMLC